MVRLEWPGASAVRAGVAVAPQQREPLDAGEEPSRCDPARSIGVLLGALDLGMAREIRLALRIQLRAVTEAGGATVVPPPLAQQLGMPRSPASHRFARLLRIPFQPLTRI